MVDKNAAYFPITAENKTDKAFRAVKGNLDGLQKSALAIGAAVATATAAYKFGSAIVSEAETAERQLFKLNAIVKTTGTTAGFTGEQFDKMARDVARNTLASTEGVRDAIGVLATFRSVSGDTFKRTIELSQDMAAVMGTDIKTAALQLGKALEDPAKGLTALNKSGVTFTESEKDLIKTLVQSGDMLKAHGLILDKVAVQVGGVGKAEAGGLSGAVDTLGQNWSEFLESIGNLGPLSGATKSVTFLADAVQRLQGLLISSDEQTFTDYVREREELEQQIENASWIRNTKPLERRLAFVKGKIQELQDANIERLKKENEAARAGFSSSLEPGARALVRDVLGKTQTEEEKAQQKADEQRQKSIEAINKSLKEEADTWGMTREEIALYRLELLGATDAQIRAAKASIDTVAANEQQSAALEAYADDMERALLETWEYERAQRALYQSVLDSVDPMARFRKEMLDLELALEVFPELTDDIIKQMEKLETELGKGSDEMGQFAVQAARNIQDELGDGLFNIMQGNFESIGDSFKIMLDRMVADALAAQIAKQMFGDFDTTGQVGGWASTAFDFLGGFFGGGKASGGPVSAGRLYEVNERGTELLSMGGRDYLMMGSQSGNITPSTGGTTVNVPITIYGSQGAGNVMGLSERQLQAAAHRGVMTGLRSMGRG